MLSLFDCRKKSEPGSSCWKRRARSARRALALDPGSAESLAALGYMSLSQRRYAEMDDAFEQALRLDAKNPAALFWGSNALSSMGRTSAAEGLIDRLLKNDPSNPTALTYKGVTRLINGDLEQANQASERSDALGYPVGRIGTSLVAARRGENWV